MVPNSDTPTVNFDTLKRLLLSSVDDVASKNELEELISSKKFQFLDGKVDMKGNRICLASYPRSGNTFCRLTIEKVTGIYTGADAFIQED